MNHESPCPGPSLTQDIAARAAEQDSLSKAEAERAVNTVLEAIRDALASGERIVIAACDLGGEGVYVNVFVLTSADRIYAEHKKAKKVGRPSHLEMMVGDEHRDNPIVSVLDGHSLALSFLGGALGADQRRLGADQFAGAASPTRSTTPCESDKRTSRRRAGRWWGRGE